MKFGHLGIGTRLAFGFGAVLLLAVTAVLAYTRFVQTQQQFLSAGDMSRRAAPGDRPCRRCIVGRFTATA